MLPTGDVQGCLRKLESLLRVIRFKGEVDYDGLSKGDPSAFLPIVSFSLTSLSPPLVEQLMAAGLELTGKTDLRFTDTVYKVLRDILHYKPILSKQQFLQWGFSQRKISVVCDIINLVLQKHNQLTKPRVRCPGSLKDVRQEDLPITTDADTVIVKCHTAMKSTELPERSFVVNCVENHSTFPTSSSSNMTSASRHVTISPENGITELDKDVLLQMSELQGRLSAVETKLESVLSGFNRLCIIEKHLEDLYSWRNQNKNEGETITICRESWENLMSRVLLLETKLELSNTQEETQHSGETNMLPCSNVPINMAFQVNPEPLCPSFSSSPHASVNDLKDRLESITNMLKSTSSFLKSTESPIQQIHDK